MRFKPSLIIAFAVFSFMFLSSLICLIFQPDLGAIIALWEIALAVSFFIIVALAIYARIWEIGLPIKSYLFFKQSLFFD